MAMAHVHGQCAEKSPCTLGVRNVRYIYKKRTRNRNENENATQQRGCRRRYIIDRAQRTHVCGWTLLHDGGRATCRNMYTKGVAQQKQWPL